MARYWIDLCEPEVTTETRSVKKWRRKSSAWGRKVDDQKSFCKNMSPPPPGMTALFQGLLGTATTPPAASSSLYQHRRNTGDTCPPAAYSSWRFQLCTAEGTGSFSATAYGQVTTLMDLQSARPPTRSPIPAISSMPRNLSTAESRDALGMRPRMCEVRMSTKSSCHPRRYAWHAAAADHALEYLKTQTLFHDCSLPSAAATPGIIIIQLVPIHIYSPSYYQQNPSLKLLRHKIHAHHERFRFSTAVSY